MISYELKGTLVVILNDPSCLKRGHAMVHNLNHILINNVPVSLLEKCVILIISPFVLYQEMRKSRF